MTKPFAVVSLWMLVATALGVAAAPHALADANCAPGGPPPGAATKDVSALYGQPAMLWITDAFSTGITTTAGTGSTGVYTPSPMVQRALLIDAQQDGNHQLIVDTGRESTCMRPPAAASRPSSTGMANRSSSTKATGVATARASVAATSAAARTWSDTWTSRISQE
jgi:hypothetical protein